MFTAYSSPAESTRTWFVVADRSQASFFTSEGGVKGFQFLRRVDNPDGRKKNREIESDRGGKSMAEGNANYPRTGLVNKDEAKFHVMQLFVQDLASEIKKARAENEFDRLVLVCEPRMLGEFRSTLDKTTQSYITAEIEKEWSQLPEAQLKERLAEALLQ